ncbi:MAG TPA: hypothetical protein VLX59_09355 [Acidimicrobiales bacterium]|nr:hypothetical protein [Acidimicrobiales bacterium]
MGDLLSLELFDVATTPAGGAPPRGTAAAIGEPTAATRTAARATRARASPGPAGEASAGGAATAGTVRRTRAGRRT